MLSSRLAADRGIHMIVNRMARPAGITGVKVHPNVTDPFGRNGKLGTDLVVRIHPGYFNNNTPG